jgi:hypothetical protein
LNKLACANGKHCQKVMATDKPIKNKIYHNGKENQFKTKGIGH